jgi:DNA-directed RNA polymerase sigma subunit (sigma70/sigma32)
MSIKSKRAELERLEQKVREYGEKRRARIMRLRREGKTFQAIADKLGITHQRVQQIAAKGE